MPFQHLVKQRDRRAAQPLRFLEKDGSSFYPLREAHLAENLFGAVLQGLAALSTEIIMKGSEPPRSSSPPGGDTGGAGEPRIDVDKHRCDGVKDDFVHSTRSRLPYGTGSIARRRLMTENAVVPLRTAEQRLSTHNGPLGPSASDQAQRRVEGGQRVPWELLDEVEAERDRWRREKAAMDHAIVRRMLRDSGMRFTPKR
jgi:hypothetical protein